MGWNDRTDSRALGAEPKAEYPWIQWVNRGNDLDPRHQEGGFFITSPNMDMLGSPEIEGAEACSQVFSNGDSETGIYLNSINVAILATRFAWQKKEGERYSRSPTYTPGARGKLQALVFLQTQEGERAGPVLVTLTGTITKDMSEAIKQHRRAVQKGTSGKGASAWFWMTVAAGTPEQRGRGNAQSTVTPIVCVDCESFDPDTRYIGDDATDWIEDTWEIIEEWRDAWVVTASEPSQDLAPPADNQAPVQQNTLPTTQRTGAPPIAEARKLWSEQWNKLKKLGLVAPFMGNEWSIAQIQTSTVYMVQAAESLDHGESLEIAAANLITKLETI